MIVKNIFLLSLFASTAYLFINIYVSNKIILINKHQNDRIQLYSFDIIYKYEIKKLNKDKEMTLDCFKQYKNFEKRRSECSKYKSSIPSYTRIPYKEIYKEYKGGYEAIIEPSYKNDIDIIVGIPFAPPLIDGRIVARTTYMREKRIDGYKAMYVFFTGLIPQKMYSYNYSLLEEEADLFDDIMVFNMINTYWNITLLLMSMHKWIIENYPYIKYFIRCNLDAVFVPSRINGLLHKDYDVIAQIGSYICWKVDYPQGFFYIFSSKMVKYIYDMSFKKRIHRMDDIFYGQIISQDKSIKIYNLKNQSDFFCTFCPLLYTKSFISLHGYIYSPAMVYLFYSFTINNTNSNII